MQIEVGKKYVSRAGFIVEIVREIKNQSHPFLGIINHGYFESPATFSKEGFFNEANSNSLYDLDLTKEVEK